MQFANVARLERLAEHTVLGTNVYRQDDDNLSAIIDTGLSSWAFVFFGFKVLGTRLIWGLVCTVLCGIWLRLFSDVTTGPMIIAALALGCGGVIFSMPSRSTLSGVKSQNVSRVRSVIVVFVKTSSELDSFSTAHQIIKTHAFDRIGRFNVIAGVAWAVLFWFWSSFIFRPPEQALADGGYINFAVLAALIFVILFLVSACHAAAVRAVYLTIDFAIIEARSELE